MATSGYKSVSVTSHDTLKFSWELSSQSVANNTSTVSWKMQLISDSSGRISSTASKNWSVTVNGTKYSGTNKVDIAASTTKTLASGSTTISHNTDGTKTFSYSFSQEFNITFSGSNIGTKSGSSSGTLTTIPRAATITSAPNFTDVDNPTIKYNNSLGNSVTSLKACIASEDGATIFVPYRDISKTGTSYTFNLTDAERDTLRNECFDAKSMTVKFYVQTVYSGSTYRSSLAKTFSIDDAAPTVSATAKDVGSSSTALTGDANIMIKGFNNISVSMIATAKKGASIKSYKITNGSSVINAASGEFPYTENNKFTFSATDTRGYTTTKTVTLTMIDYISLTCNLSSLSMDAEGDLNFTISGKAFTGSFGAVNNTLTVEYRYKEDGGSYGAWTAATAQTSGNTYSANVSLSGLNYQSNYTFQGRVIDKISNKTSAEKKVKTSPLFDWGETDFNFNVPVTITEGNTQYNFSSIGKALMTNISLPCTVTAGENYSSASGSCYLIGNVIRVYFTATRNSKISAGNNENEVICNFSVDTGGKVLGCYTVYGICGNNNSCFYLSSASVSGNTLSFGITLSSVGLESSTFMSYFAAPVRIDLSKF